MTGERRKHVYDFFLTDPAQLLVNRKRAIRVWLQVAFICKVLDNAIRMLAVVLRIYNVCHFQLRMIARVLFCRVPCSGDKPAEFQTVFRFCR